MTCKDCIYCGVCWRTHNEDGPVDIYADTDVGRKFRAEKHCPDFKDKAFNIEVSDETILYTKDNWLVIDLDSKSIGAAIKSIFDYMKGDTL